MSVYIERIQEHRKLIENIELDVNIKNLIDKISNLIVNSINSGNKLIVAGNGGSFADAFHFAGEFVCRFNFDRNPLPAIALGGNNSILSAVGNDYSYNDVFAREIQAIGNKGDIFIAISTSGNSENILNAVNVALNKGIIVYGFTGRDGGKIKDLCECVKIQSDKTPRIQEAHELLYHIICEIVEGTIFNNK